MNPHGARSAGAAAAPAANRDVLLGFFGVFRYSRRAIQLVWETNRTLLLAMALLTLAAGLLPAGVAWIGAQIVDAVVNARAVAGHNAARVLRLVLLEGCLVAGVAGAQRGLSLCQALLRAQLGQRVNVMILEKALTLELRHFEDSEFYDKLTRARRGFQPPLEPGDAHFRPDAERDLAAQLRRAAGAILALDHAGAAGGGTAGIRRGGEVLGRRLPAVPLALTRDAHAGLPRDGAGARGSRQGGQAVRPGTTAAAALSRHLHPPVSQGSRVVDQARQLGLWPEPAGDRGPVRRLCLDRAVDHPRAHHARADDDVSVAVSPGSERRVGHPVSGRRHV